MFWSSEASLALTHFRAYDPELGRWLSRDPLRGAEMKQGPNLYAYVRNEPVNHIDPEGLCEDTVCATCLRQPCACAMAGLAPTMQAAAPVAVATGILVEEAGGPEAVVEGAVGVGESCVALAETLAASPAVQQTLQSLAPRPMGLNDALMYYGETLVPALEQTLPSAETEAGFEEAGEWADLYREFWFKFREVYNGDYSDFAGLARTAQVIQMLENYAILKGGEPY